MMWIIIAFCASLLTALQFIPQVIVASKTKRLKGVSLGSFSIVAITSSLWILHGIHTHDYAILTANILTLLCSVVIIIFTMRKK